MSSSIKISIVTVTYNSGKTLEGTIQSVLSQDYSNIEYIIIDGGSEDNTIDIIKKYETVLPITWISEADNGLYDAMNKGIRLATGDIVGTLNSDDFYHHTNIITNIANIFISNSIDCIYGDIRFVRSKNLEKTVRYYSSKNFKISLFKWGFMPAHPTFYVRRILFESIGYYKTDYKIAADYELLIRFLYKNRIKSLYIPIDFLKMRIGGASTNSLRSNLLLNKEIVRACKENGIYTNLFYLSFKYFYKMFELINTRNK